MAFLNFGQPVDGLVQIAFVVEDIHASMSDLTRRLRIGPWFLREHAIFEKQLYRGQPSRVELSLAMGYAGHMMFELIQQHNDVPSVYREVIERRGYGLHHFGVAATRFDESVELYRSHGCDLVFFAEVLAGVRVAYMDCAGLLPAMVEIIEMTPSVETMFTSFQQASVGWDGSNPVRLRTAPSPAGAAARA
ncbi:MAG TPA: VOC family protein [Xanthobacteraceae bacterium]